MMSGIYLRVYPLHAPALCIPLHSRYMRRSRSARDSSDELRWYVTLLTPFFLVAVSVVALLCPVEFLANATSDVATRHRPTAKAKTACRYLRGRRVIRQDAIDEEVLWVRGMVVLPLREKVRRAQCSGLLAAWQAEKS